MRSLSCIHCEGFGCLRCLREVENEDLRRLRLEVERLRGERETLLNYLLMLPIRTGGIA